MPGLDTRIQDLIAYADSRDDSNKTALFRNLIDLFLTEQAPAKEPTRSQLLEVLSKLTPNVDRETRITAADLVAAMPNPPADLAYCLALDTVDIAEPLLTSVPFDEDQLVALVELAGKGHHQIIADRSDLTANVWIALARASRDGNSEWPGSRSPSDMETKPVSTSNVTPIHGARLSVKPLAAAKKSVPNPTAPPAPSNGNPSDQPSVEQDIHSWGFASDRDGFVSALTENAQDYVPDHESVIGEPLLDFLGLNAKLGHPVARAFQRRSAIHDAPIYLGTFPRGQRYWALTATPHFSGEKQTFAGYQGRLAPALQDAKPTTKTKPTADTKSASRSDSKAQGFEQLHPDLPNSIDKAALKRDPLKRVAARGKKTAGELPVQEAEAAPVFEKSEAEVSPVPASIMKQRSQPKLDAVKAVPAANQAPSSSAAVPDISKLIETLIAETVSTRLEKEVSEAVAKQVDVSQLTQDPAVSTSPIEIAETPQKTPLVADPDTIEALDSLSHALTALRYDSEGIKPTNRSLQIALAETCCKVLKEALDKRIF